ncbi:tetraspanin 36 [Scyliorhinus canicula]|uniref:tetraspanin 36 n=1 Tax=Scyliorhinus canicula TaxID=7830 RepID=UPI0018F59DBE|nr:tetraspanin 36 [Scyliorhinus canicula]
MDWGVLTSKSILIFLSLIFWAAGGVLIYVGAALLSTFKNYNHFFEDQYTVLPAFVIIGVAFVMFLIGLIGCCAALKESRFALGLFMFILFIIFAAEVSAFVMGFIYRRQVHEGVNKSMAGVFAKYNGKNSESRAVDYLQEQMKCCGINNYTYWETTDWFNKGNKTFPQSCCKHQFSNCTGNPNHPELLNTAGCEMKLETGLESILSYAILVILGFAIIQLFGMVSICVISCRRKSDYQPLPSGMYA